MSLSLFALTDKVAIVTGAGRGIGKAVALGLAEAGANVVVAARTVSDIENTATEISALGRKTLAVPTDVRLSEQVDNLVQRTTEKFGRIDILVNNAGGSFNARTLDISEGGWDAIMRENLKSVFLMSKAVGKIMAEQQKGNIISMSSVAAFFSYQVNASYGAAKAGIIALTKTLAADLGPSKVRVNAIAPGYIETLGIAQVYRDFPDLRERRASKVPLRRLGGPEDVIGTAIFLASDASDYITGQTIIIDGGFSCFLERE